MDEESTVGVRYPTGRVKYSVPRKILEDAWRIYTDSLEDMLLDRDGCCEPRCNAKFDADCREVARLAREHKTRILDDEEPADLEVEVDE